MARFFLSRFGFGDLGDQLRQFGEDDGPLFGVEMLPNPGLSGGFSRKGRLSCMMALLRGRWTVAESVDEDAELKQVGQGAQPRPFPLGRGRDARLSPVRPSRGNQRPALVRQDQQEVKPAVPVRVAQDLKGTASKRMALADTGD